MRQKVKVQNPDYSNWAFSVAFHGFFALTVFFVLRHKTSEEIEAIPFEVISNPNPVAVSSGVTPKALKPLTALQPKTPPAEKSRAVFGQSKKAITSEESNVSFKAGNTIAKEVDNLKLQKGDSDALPIPVDEYMVTSMPKITREIRAPYPPEAKAGRVQGIVSLELLIDQEGRVRQAKVLRGPGAGLDQAALQAASQFLFEPARVGENKVAVLIRYNYKFVLE